MKNQDKIKRRQPKGEVIEYGTYKRGASASSRTYTEARKVRDKYGVVWARNLDVGYAQWRAEA